MQPYYSYISVIQMRFSTVKEVKDYIYILYNLYLKVLNKIYHLAV